MRCVASDVHSLHRRPPAIVQGLSQVVQLIGQVKIQQLIEGCPMMIINNVPCGV
jgi:tyrosine-protein phosphatase YwqE